ncbi:S8 family serine peptidase [Georhizobium sp. MAB10]|uniref:S8 family serine peptidase n=1 Tax=Georhizobium sp. MAB10 TaxID=3028319 RepID=UPI0038558ACF
MISIVRFIAACGLAVTAAMPNASVGTGALVAGAALVHTSAPAFAQEGDDGDDGGDDDGGGGGGAGSSGGGRSGGDGESRQFRGGSGQAPEFIRRPLRTLRSLFDQGSPPPRQARRAAPQPAPLPDRAERELTALGLDDDDVAALEAQGFAVDERVLIELLGGELVRLVAPDGVSLDDARATVVGLNATSAVDFNHYYRPEARPLEDCEGMNCPATELIDWHFAATEDACVVPARIGLIDTGINPDHDAFSAGSVTVLDRVGQDEETSDLKHGTAVAALLVGSKQERTSGLLPGADLVAVDAFQTAGADTRATAYDLVRAIDRVAREEIAVLNLSLAGPANELLERTVAAIAENGIILVAAAGNNGPSAPPAYPAAYENVIAVTAVDRSRRPYRRAGQGDHIDIAAPGVEIWTAASISGARPKTGTSFAAPFVTAAIALAKAIDPTMDAATIADHLEASADDLGDPGRDAVFGWGLLNTPALCRAVTAAQAEDEAPLLISASEGGAGDMVAGADPNVGPATGGRASGVR